MSRFPLPRLLAGLSLAILPLTLHAQWSVRVSPGQRPQDTFPESDPRRKLGLHLMQPFTAEEWEASSFAPKEAVERWKDLRYGMFIHFGLSTHDGKELSWGTVKHIKAPDGHAPVGVPQTDPYTQWPKDLKMEKFDAKEWVRIAKDAGFRYIVVISKHHDGFHMWDTAESDFKITNTPFGRDYLKEIADACHEAGMPFGIYYAQREWYHPDYDPKNPQGERHRRYVAYNNRVVHELCTKYGKIDIFWFDAAWWNKMFTADMWDAEALYRQIRKDQPDIMINNRASIPGDFDTPEQQAGYFQERPWESCLCLTATWSWSGTPPKSADSLIRAVAGSAAANGNVLLSWGPKWDGEFDAKEKARLAEIGAWMKTNGESIFGTRTGPWLPAAWGGSTQKGAKVYLHAFDTKPGSLTLPGIPGKITAARLLDGGAKVEFSQTPENITVRFPEYKYSPDTVVELTFDKAPEGAPIRSAALALSLFDDTAAYGKRLRVTDLSKLKTPGVIDLGKPAKVTGVRLADGAAPVSVKVETSEDGKTWEPAGSGVIGPVRSEVAITTFTAGVQVPGRTIRYLRITPENGGAAPAPGTATVFGL